MEYIHYGDKIFNRNKFSKIKNINFVKPEGGLWASRIDSKYGWIDWVKDNNFRTDEYRNDNYFKFKLNDKAKILIIDSVDILKKLPINRNIPYPIIASWVNLDFEELSKKYDAIEVLISKDERLYWELYGWDCDSILIMNEDVIEEV